MEQALLVKLLTTFGTTALGALTWGIAKLVGLIAAKTKNEWTRGFLVRLDDLVTRVVKDVFTGFVDPLQKSGRWDTATAAQAKQQALNAIKAYLGPQGIDELAKLLGANDTIDQFLGTFIEAAVHDTKQVRSDLGGLPTAVAPLQGAPIPAKSVDASGRPVPTLVPQPEP